MEYDELSAAQYRRSREFASAQTDAMATYCEAEQELRELHAENAKLREQMERLVTLLRVDCDIDASWDGLRRFWSIELTESGCLMRDRACRAEAENAKLRELVRELYEDQCIDGDQWKYRDRMRELGVVE